MGPEATIGLAIARSHLPWRTDCPLHRTGIDNGSKEVAGLAGQDTTINLSVFSNRRPMFKIWDACFQNELFKRNTTGSLKSKTIYSKMGEATRSSYVIEYERHWFSPLASVMFQKPTFLSSRIIAELFYLFISVTRHFSISRITESLHHRADFQNSEDVLHLLRYCRLYATERS